MRTTLILAFLFVAFLAACQPNQIEQSTPIVAGAPLPLTGSNAWYGQYTQAGLKVAVEDINRQGGINGRQVVLVIEDTAGDRAKATTAAQKLVDVDNAEVLFTVSTPMAGAAAPVAEQSQRLLVYQSATSSFAINSTYVFKDYPDASEQCMLLAQQALRDGHDKIAVFGTNTEFTHQCVAGVKTVSEPIAVEMYTAGDRDYRTALTKIRSSEPTALVLSQFAPDCPNTFQQLRELDVTPPLYISFSTYGCGSESNIQEGKDLLNAGVGADIDVDETAVPSDLKERFSAEASSYIVGSATWYDIFNQVAKAYEGCPDTACAAANLRSMEYEGITGSMQYQGGQTIKRDLRLNRFTGESWQEITE